MSSCFGAVIPLRFQPIANPQRQPFTERIAKYARGVAVMLLRTWDEASSFPGGVSRFLILAEATADHHFKKAIQHLKSENKSVYFHHRHVFESLGLLFCTKSMCYYLCYQAPAHRHPQVPAHLQASRKVCLRGVITSLRQD